MTTIWTDDFEYILDRIRQNSVNMSDYHRRQYFRLHHSLNYFKIPIIVISALNSVLSVMLNKFMAQDIVSVLTSVLALITGIIGSTELFLKVSERMEIELNSSKNYYLLQADIYRVLNLNRVNRNDDPMTFLNTCFEEYRKLWNSSNIRKRYIRDYFVDIEKDFTKLSGVDIDSVDIPIARSRNVSVNEPEIKITVINKDEDDKIEEP